MSATNKTLLAACAGLLASVAVPRPAAACKCGGYSQPALIAPVGAPAPRNAVVRLALPNEPQPPIEIVVEGPARRAVRMTKRTTKHRDFTAVELKPVGPFESASKYEVVALERYPTGPVRKSLGTFSVTAEVDTIAPRIEGLAAPRLVHLREPDGAACDVEGPWVEVPGIRAVDPDRSTARLGYYLWLGRRAKDAAPTAWLESPADGLLRFGPTSLCAAHLFDLPTGARFDVTVVAVDEAGNESAPIDLVVDRASVIERERPARAPPATSASTAPVPAATSTATSSPVPARSKSGCALARTAGSRDANAVLSFGLLGIALWWRRTTRHHHRRRVTE